MIQHSVIFKLKHPKGSAEETLFLNAAKALVSIPGVRNFNCLKQVSPKNKFEYGLTMEFSDQAAYDAYSRHEKHEAFIQDFWVKDVEDFLEIDYEQL
ncbi:Dabb family protein [Dyadobacter sp. CY345]|uniref:Dabb family protein n=1 Tax=Dyadobacter sp. CY345 TaxID=2909335 RepID=UPI001F246955|nr:Dabb family protein [Dyadobacter sp. CY345]MCF2446839.1 Dabb family protein [Dyadobacter sp. CY345]